MKEILNEAKPIIILLVGCGVLIGAVTWFMGLDNSSSNIVADYEATSETLEAPLAPEKLEAYNVDIVDKDNPIAVINTNLGTIEIELYEDRMPITAGNFAKLVEEGFYDGVKFHRVIDGFMIQGGDPNTKTEDVMTYGRGGPGYAIPDEHIDHELLTNVRGTISMANSGPESGGSQFFINLVDNQNLDFNKQPLSSKHPVFGRVVAGMDVVDKIGGVATNQIGLPDEDVVMESVTMRR